ncbi:MAG: META domain-containing protein [Tenuifilaceae bacterium]|nr:META domain-containing protein [Tenuifilaceae bacterium]
MRRLCFLVLGLVMVSCGATKQVPTQIESTLYNKWVLVQLNGNRIKSDQPLFLEFNRTSKVSGYAGCNSLGGDFVLGEGQSIRFSDLITTYRYCDQAELEGQVLDMLNTVTHYSIEAQALTLKLSNGVVIAEYTLVNENVTRGMLEQ